MARWYSRLMTSRQGFRSGGVFMVGAVLIFGAIVFLLFRGRGAGPQEAAAMDTASTPAPAEAAQPVLPPTMVEAAAGDVPSPEQDAPQSPSRILPPEMTPLPTGGASPQNPQVEAALTEAVSLLRTQPSEVIQVRNKLNKLLQGATSPEQRQKIKDEMAKLSRDWLFGPAAFPGDMLCDTYAVKSGDLLEIIGRRLKVPYQILMQINGIQRARALQAGRPIKVIHGPFRATVSRSTFTLDLYLQDMYVRSFKVGLGAPDSETPTGLWRVKDGGKLIQPPWYDKRTNRTYKASDPDYPLGTRWIALDGLEGNAKGRTGFAIHGTKDPEQIGTAASQGCIRMHNTDVELMYSLLIPIYSQVEVVD